MLELFRLPRAANAVDLQSIPRDEGTAGSFAFPDAEELGEILGVLGPETRAAAVVMSSRGLRTGAFPSLMIRAGRFTAQSKGKDISGRLPAEAPEAMRAAGLDGQAPFVGLTARKITDRMRLVTRSPAAEGKLETAYSVHDLRHFFAVRECRRMKDLYRVSKLLGHASIEVKETYLRGLGERDDEGAS